MKVDGRVAVAAVMAALFVTMATMAATYPMEAATVPLLVAVPALLLCGWQLKAEMAAAQQSKGFAQRRDATSARPRDIREQPARLEDELALIAWLGAFAAAIIAAGFLAGGTLAVVSYLRLRLREPMTVAAA